MRGSFIISTAAGIATVAFTGSIINNQSYLTDASINEGQIINSLSVLIMAFSLAMIPVVLFPLLKKHNEASALVAVVSMGVPETVAYIALVVTWLFSAKSIYKLAHQRQDAGVIRKHKEPLLGCSKISNLTVFYIVHILCMRF